MWHAWKRREMHVDFWLENPEGNKLLVGPTCKWDDNIKMHLINCTQWRTRFGIGYGPFVKQTTE
jgi:hypothetical protein